MPSGSLLVEPQRLEILERGPRMPARPAASHSSARSWSVSVGRSSPPTHSAPSVRKAAAGRCRRPEPRPENRREAQQSGDQIEAVHEPRRGLQRFDPLDEHARVDPAAAMRGRGQHRAELFTAKPGDQHGDPLIEGLESRIAAKRGFEVLEVGRQPAADQPHQIGRGPKQNRRRGELAPPRAG